MTLTPLELFENKKQAGFTFLFFTFIFLLHVGYEYVTFKDFKANKSLHVKGDLLQTYQKKSKHGKPYHVLKIKTDKAIIYTTYWKKSLHVRIRDGISLYVVTKNVSFKDYLSRSFFAPSFKIKSFKKPPTLVDTILSKINSQHESKIMQELFGALFLASPIGKELREYIQNWGVSHLVAISGFHLGVIYGFGYFLIIPIYRFFQDRYFPYRNAKLDVGIFLFGVLLYYLWLIDYVPSFLRAFLMSLLGFYFLYRNIKVLSFTNLAFTCIILLSIFPHLSLSLGFWFSVMGVFYIFLYLHHFKDRFKNWQHAIFINFWVFLAMNIPIHYWFGLTSWQQFGTIPLSLVFIVFYPISAFLHLIGQGALLDSYVLELLHVKLKTWEFVTPLWMFVGFIGLSLVSIRWKLLSVVTIFLSIFPLFFI